MGDGKMFRRFLQGETGSIGPIFAVCLPLLVAIVGGAVDYSRVEAHRGKLQAVTNMAVLAANQEAKSGKERRELAQKFIEANMPDADLQTRRIVSNGDIMFQVLSTYETPLLSIIGRPKFHVVAEARMPKGRYGKNGKFKPVSYSSKQLRQIRANMERMIANAPAKYRGHYRREYERYYQTLERNKRKR